MVRNLLVRGMLAGLAAAVLALVFAYIFGEPQVGAAISLEETMGHAAEAAVASAEPEPVSRGVQSTVGLATAIGLYGVAVGGVFALVFAFVYGRLGTFGARGTAALVAVGAFVTVELVPFLKYPANPPAVGDPETIGRRSALYFAIVAISVLLAVAAVYVGRRLASRHGNWNATLLAGAGLLAAVVVVSLLMPAIDEVPAGFPAALLWRFRLASIGTQAVLWGGIGLLFGALADRALAPHRRPVSTAVA
ncbi:CbtA family protein [Sphaerisporangium corydalis]|uniref:CbtA family protein n=1 Tax=Sphaerisporangium corydalis TaxID=1441875 RepID=A0ABV9EB96_9ACTN|nr:CbtA family protein [Sphaerisporangium corydalis]